MAFTAQEKVEASRFVLGMIELSKGLEEVAEVVGQHAHDMRPQISKALSNVRGTWIHSRFWFGHLTDTVAREGWTREFVLSEGKKYHSNVVQSVNSLVAHCATVPELSAANVHFTAARDIFAPFDWSLPYTQPRHDNNPNTPFDDAKTVVGPHGDWTQAVGVLMFVMWYTGETWNSFDYLYASVPVTPQEANGPLRLLVRDFAHIVNRIPRVYSMHIECEAPQDAATIDADHAAASGARSRAFHRAMLQNELLFNQRASIGSNWHGREFEIGAVNALNFQHLQDWSEALVRANDADYSWELLVKDAGSGGPVTDFIVRMTDFWQVLDAWAVTAFGFFHHLPKQTIFVPIDPEPPTGTTTIPLGFFNSQAAQIAQAKAEMFGVQSELNALESSLRSLEGTEV